MAQPDGERLPPDLLDPSDTRLAAPTPYEVLLGDVDHILSEWRDLVRLEPWTRIPAERLIDSFPEILPRLIRLAESGAPHMDEELKGHITDGHGFLRREDALPLLAVAEEWSHLKRACGNVLARRGVPERAIGTAMQRLDVLVDDAIGYTLRGYYRLELDGLRGKGLERRDSGVHDRRSGSTDRRTRGEPG
ncbi:MAG: hypothetical protein WKG32_14140 [Gemmatimonadaceae bacterium]